VDDGGALGKELRQRDAVMSRRRVGHEAGRLVHDHQIGVLEDDLEGSRLRWACRRGIVFHDRHPRPLLHAVVLRACLSVHVDGTRVDQALGRGARRGGAARRQERV
jgi:hypothetical protein